MPAGWLPGRIVSEDWRSGCSATRRAGPPGHPAGQQTRCRARPRRHWCGGRRPSPLPAEPEFLMYTPFLHRHGLFAALRPTVLVRSSAPLKRPARGSGLTPARSTVARLHAAAPADRSARPAARRPRLLAWVLTPLGVLGFLLAAVGSTACWRRSLANARASSASAWRSAPAAPRNPPRRRQAAWIAALGGTAGLGLAALGSRLVESQLVGVTRLDPRCTQCRSRLLLPSSLSRVRGPRGRQRKHRTS